MKDVSQDVLAVISSGVVDGNTFTITAGTLDRRLYIAVNEVLENIGGKWSRKLKAHVFDADPTDKIEEVLLTAKTVNEKQLYQFFETPKPVVERLLELADIQYTDDPMKMQDVTEPSAGRGAIADEIDGSRCLFRVTELDPKNVQVLMDKGYAVFAGDWLNVKDKEFDRIIMNPPFTRQQDIDHVKHAFDLLRPSGRVVAVMSPGFTFRQNNKSVEFRELVDTHGWWEELPDDSFKESGTGVRTVIVVLNR